MKRPDFLSYQELLDQECVAVPDALRVDTQPEIPSDLIATDRWTDQGVFDKDELQERIKVGLLMSAVTYFHDPSLEERSEENFINLIFKYYLTLNKVSNP